MEPEGAVRPDQILESLAGDTGEYSGSVDVAGLGREGSMRFLAYCERMMRENFITNLRIPGLVYLNQDEETFSRKFSPFINERNVERLLNEFESARLDISANGNAKIIFFDLAVKVILLLKQ